MSCLPRRTTPDPGSSRARLPPPSLVRGATGGLVLLAALLALPTARLGAAADEPAADDRSRIRFREASADWGLVFHHHHGGSGRRYMAETVVGGVVLFDYDGDGDPDVFFVDGGALPGSTGAPPRSRLFRNDAGGGADGGPRFVDVTERAGLDIHLYGSGAVAGDVDGDGQPDLLVTGLDGVQLFINRGDGSFVETTAAAGLGAPPAAGAWRTSATLFDADRDGDLDLYLVGYVDFTLDNHRPCRDTASGVESYCHPGAYAGLPDHFFLNRGDGTFVDATTPAGFAGPRLAGLGVVAGDLDGDGWPDLYVANDAHPNLLFRNRGVDEEGRVSFEDVSLVSGTAYGHDGRAEGGMGVEMADADGDGRPDLFVTNFEVETNAYYRNLGSGLFQDLRFPSGLAVGSRPMLAFGTVFADFDHDGDLDLAIANGHILDNAAEIDPNSAYAQRNQIYENLGRGRFVERREAGLDVIAVSRGMAHGDLDLDGDLDLVIVNSNGRAEVYENVARSPGGWLLVALDDEAGQRQGVGARLELATEGGESVAAQVREVRTASSYLSQNDLPVHFGVGEATTVRLTVRWPDGRVQRFEGLPPDRRLRLWRGPPARGGEPTAHAIRKRTSR